MERPTWPHLENLDRIRAEHQDWFDPKADWIVTEKIHGFNGRFGVDDNGLAWVGSRNQIVCEGDPTVWPMNGLQGFVGFAAEHVLRVPRGVTLFGEWAGKGVQKGIDYGPKGFYLFGMMFADGRLGDWREVATAASCWDLRHVPLLYNDGGLPSVVQLTEWRDGISAIAPTTREGIVLTQDPPAKDQYGHYLIGKFKGAAFSENLRTPGVTQDFADMTVLNNFVADYATPVRLLHVLDQVAEAQGEPVYGIGFRQANPLDVAFTGEVLRAMYNDVVREAGAEFEALSEADQKRLGKVLSPATKKLLEAARTEALA